MSMVSACSDEEPADTGRTRAGASAADAGRAGSRAPNSALAGRSAPDDSAKQKASQAGFQNVSIRFKAKLGRDDFACGMAVSGIGRTNATVQPADFRLFIHDVKLINAQAEAVRVVIDNRVPWQSRPPKPWHGHVAFYTGDTVGKLVLLGGNQNNAVCLRDYARARLISYRWPPGAPIPTSSSSPAPYLASGS
jgi:hypothetical protein